MAAVIRSLMSKEPVTWLLYGIGASIALVAELCKIPPLPLALGMYLPLELTTPLLVGGFLSHLVKNSSQDKELAEKRHNKGMLISSGFIAGGALMGIVLAVLKLAKLDHFVSLGIPMVLENGKWLDGTPASWFSQYGEIISLVAFILLVGFVYWQSQKEK
ncbi:MAG: OPT/YSL family transporter, partial [Candidatus Saccharicenans sp.]|nr:OPT/YSL family transporter [Candidatus Saccharicenans sp.]